MRSRILDGGSNSNIRSRQVKASINNWFFGGGGVPAETFTLRKLSVKYTNTDFAYITTKSGFDNNSTFNAGTNIIGLCTIVPDDTANSSLAYDQETDRLVVLHLDAGGHIGCKFFEKPAVQTAFAAALGTIPATDYSFVADGVHGMTLDPTTQILYVWTQANTVKEYNITTGTLLATRTQDTGYSTPGTISYNYETGDMWFCIGTETDQTAKRATLVSGNWVVQETTWFTFSQEIAVDPFLQGLITKKMSGDGTWHFLTQKFDGIDCVYNRYASDSAEFISNTQQTIRDARNGTFWINLDIQYHEPTLPNNNCIMQMDPLGYYRKYLRFPDMHRFDLFKKTSTQSGQYNSQILTGNNWDIAPVVDYGAYTGQQDINNWEIGEEDAAELEFRGSASAPTTTIIDDYDNENIKIYDANGTNDGWGATTPGAWQSTPTTDRYMQVRVKPIEYVPTWTPADLGSDLIAWFEQNSLDGLIYEQVDSDRCPISINYVNPYDNMGNSSATQKPIWIPAGTYLDMIASNRHYQGDSTLVDVIKALSECEVHGVARKNINTSRVIFLSGTQLTSNNYQLVCQWHPSNLAPNNLLHIRHVDSLGNISTMGVTDTTVAAWKMYTFRLGGSSNKIYINNVEQSLTVVGSNTGQCFDDIAAGMDQACIGRIRATGSLAAAQWQRGLIITKHLSDANRALLMDYMQRISMID